MPFGKTIGNKLQRTCRHCFQPGVLLLLEEGRRHARTFLKKSGKRSGAAEAYEKTNFIHRVMLRQQQPRLVYAHLREVMMRSLAIHLLKEADEMELGEIRLIRNIVQVDAFRVVRINEQLRLHHPLVEVDLGVGVLRFHFLGSCWLIVDSC